MKNVCVLLIFFIICGCKTNKSISNTNIIAIGSKCPSDGNCQIKVLENKTLVVKKDDFGKLYYQILESNLNNVIIFNFTKSVPKNVQDGNYREEIIFEIAKDDKELNLLDTKLQETKMLFGRFCYCKGYTGYYKITSGLLEIKSKKNIKQLNLNFKIDEVPQIIKTIEFKF